MRQFLKSTVKISAVSAIACALSFVSTLSANAQSQKGLEGSYVGGSFQTGNGVTGLNIYGRYDIRQLPISVRGSVSILDVSDDTVTQFAPAVTYDLPIGKKANAYAGAGLVFGEGDSTAFLNAGAETEIVQNVVVFGDLNAPLDNDVDPTFSIGLGYRF
ncbi:MAG: outer membrane beta-barrel protein [Nostocales cyanobacterium 94392]|nr:outer membrane beta-barrel protein [Nostocales cyanobacterium 94392]